MEQDVWTKSAPVASSTAVNRADDDAFFLNCSVLLTIGQVMVEKTGEDPNRYSLQACGNRTDFLFTTKNDGGRWSTADQDGLQGLW